MALREVLASFGVEFDKEGNLAKGDKQVDSLTEKLLDFGKTVAGAFAVTEIVKWGKELVNQADQIGETAERLDVSTEALQRWHYAAKLNGVEADEFNASLQRLGAGLAEASKGAGQADVFKELGVGLKRAADGTLKSSIEVFEEAGLAIGALEDPTKAAGFASALFGKQYSKLLPLFRQGPEGIAALTKEFEELGGGFSPEFIAQAEEVNDNIDRLTVGFRGLGVQVASEVLPWITEFSREAIALAKHFVSWVKGTKVVQAALGTLAAGGVAKLVASVGGLGKAVMTLGRLAMRWLAPFLVLEDVMVFLAGGKSLIGRSLDKLFGAGTAEEARQAILKWFTDMKNIVVNDVVPALKSIVESDLFKGGAKGGLDAIIVALSTIGLLITDVDARAHALTKTLKKSAAALGLGPSEEEATAALEAGKPENRKPLSGTESFTRKVVTTIFGDPLDDPELKASAEKNEAIRATEKAKKSEQLQAMANQTRFFASEPAPETQPVTSYYDTTRAAASMPAASSQVTTNNNTTNAPITTNVTVNVPPGEGELGSRVGRATAKATVGPNLRAIHSALVPTPARGS